MKKGRGGRPLAWIRKVTKRKPSGWRVGCQAPAPSPSDACVTIPWDRTARYARNALKSARAMGQNLRNSPTNDRPTLQTPRVALTQGWRLARNFAGADSSVHKSVDRLCFSLTGAISRSSRAPSGALESSSKKPRFPPPVAGARRGCSPESRAARAWAWRGSRRVPHAFGRTRPR
jgi:hypothetical protein